MIDRLRPGGVLVTLNGGIGNLVIVAPVLAALEAARPDLRCHIPDAPLLREPWMAKALPLAAPRYVGYPPLWRRFTADGMPLLRRFMAAHDIRTVLNLRCEWIEDDGRYLAFREAATVAGIDCWDLHQLSAEQQREPIGRQLVSVLRMAGVALPEPRWDWLTALRDPTSQARVGCYLGASVAVKRWPVRRWLETIALLSRPDGPPVELVGGVTEPERMLADRVLAEAGCAARPVPVADVHDLVSWIAGLDVLVSNDTMPVHLSAALGCPVVGLYLATDGAIWQPVSAPERLRVVQSSSGLHCRAMKPDGTCRQFYRGCPAPCGRTVRADQVAQAVRELSSAAGLAAS